MALGVNKVILLGNLGKDPEVQVFDGNIKKASFTLATSEAYRDRDGNRVDKVEWHNIVVWRNLAETVERYLHKGSKIYLEGKIRTRSYQDQAGNNRYITEILADNFIMLDRKDPNETGGNYTASPVTKPQTPNQAPKNEPFIQGTPFDTELPAPEIEGGDDLPF